MYAICECILFPQSSVVIALQDEKSAKDAYRIARKLCNINAKQEILNSKDNNIIFKNQSNLVFEYPKPKAKPEYIRGHRAELPLIYFDDFNIDEETLNEVLKHYIKERNIKL